MKLIRCLWACFWIHAQIHTRTHMTEEASNCNRMSKALYNSTYKSESHVKAPNTTAQTARKCNARFHEEKTHENGKNFSLTSIAITVIWNTQFLLMLLLRCFSCVCLYVVDTRCIEKYPKVFMKLAFYDSQEQSGRCWTRERSKRSGHQHKMGAWHDAFKKLKLSTTTTIDGYKRREY